MNETEESETDSGQEGAEFSTPAETRASFTKVSARGYTKLRHVLVQIPDGQERGSTVGRMVSKRMHRALLLYLLILTCWPWLKDRRVPLPAEAWLRALTAQNALTWSNSTLSRALSDLEQLNLIEKRERVGRAVRITPRREDGQDIYTAPEGLADRYNTYFTLPDSFWKDEIFAKLSLPGLAMLLVIAKETSKNAEMYVPYEQGQAWYGLKPKTVQNGITELKELEMLTIRTEWKKAPFSAIGRAPRQWYSLRADYSQEARKYVQDKSKTERAERLASRTSSSAVGKEGEQMSG